MSDFNRLSNKAMPSGSPMYTRPSASETRELLKDILPPLTSDQVPGENVFDSEPVSFGDARSTDGSEASSELLVPDLATPKRHSSTNPPMDTLEKAPDTLEADEHLADSLFDDAPTISMTHGQRLELARKVSLLPPSDAGRVPKAAIKSQLTPSQVLSSTSFVKRHHHDILGRTWAKLMSKSTLIGFRWRLC